VQAYRVFEQEVELVVGIAKGEDDVPGLEAPIDYPDTRVLEILDVETPGAVVAAKPSVSGLSICPALLSPRSPKNRLVTSTVMGSWVGTLYHTPKTAPIL